MTRTLHVDHLYERITDELCERFTGVFSPESVAAAVREARARLEPCATIVDYLPVLVGRFAQEQLEAGAQADGRLGKAVPELLFVCVQNAGRSQLAAALAEHLSGGRVHVRTAGSKPAAEVYPDVVSVLTEIGIEVSEAYPKPLTDTVVHAADVVVTMGCGDACPVLPGRRYEDWDVADPAGKPLEVVRDIRDDIRARIATLLAELGVAPTVRE